MRRVYKQLLTFVQERTTSIALSSLTTPNLTPEGNNNRPNEIERKILDIFKLVIEGGWTMSEDEFY
jgi:hypothetical protein